MATTIERKFFNAQWQPVSENDPAVEYAIEHELDENGGVLRETMLIAKQPEADQPPDLKA